MGICFIDVSEYPIVLAVIEGEIDEAEANQLVEEMLDLQKRCERYVSVNDISKLDLPNMRVRNILKTYSEASGAYCDRYLAGMATVISNPLMKTLMQMVGAFSATSYPVRYFRTRDEALVWARELIEKEGLNYPAPMGG